MMIANATLPPAVTLSDPSSSPTATVAFAFPQPTGEEELALDGLLVAGHIPPKALATTEVASFPWTVVEER